LAFIPRGRFEKHIVICIRVEGRIKINQIDAFIFDLISENRKIVAKKERINSGSEAHFALRCIYESPDTQALRRYITLRNFIDKGRLMGGFRHCERTRSNPVGDSGHGATETLRSNNDHQLDCFAHARNDGRSSLAMTGGVRSQ
jgi:hypothetical protein